MGSLTRYILPFCGCSCENYPLSAEMSISERRLGIAPSTGKRGRPWRWRSLLPGSSANSTDQAESLSRSSPLPPSKATSLLASDASPLSSLQTLSLDSGPSSPLPFGQSGQPVPTVACALGRDFLNRALQLLSQQDRASIQEYILPTADDIHSVLLSAFNAAYDKRKLCESRRWTFTIGGHSLRLRDEADKVILWLDRFKQVVDVAVNADPMHAGLPWVGIRLLLEVRYRTWTLSFYPL